MKTSSSNITLPCDPETFWAVFFDESYLKSLYLEELQYPGMDVLEMQETSRKLRIVPKMNVPGPIAKLIGESFAYEEHGTLDRAKNLWTWKMVQPSNLDPKSKPRKEAVEMHGTTRVEAMDDGRCRRTDEFFIEAKMFGVGGRIESSIEKELRSARVKEAAFLIRWLEKSNTSE